MGQVIFNLTNLIMPHEFVQNKFIQEFITLSLLDCKTYHHNCTISVYEFFTAKHNITNFKNLRYMLKANAKLQLL